MQTSTLPHIDLPANMHPTTRVWIYQAGREFTNEEVATLNALCDTFVKNWKAHGANLLTDFRVLFNRFICLFVDESAHGASGCSIDASVRFVLDMEKQFATTLTNRMAVAYLSGNAVHTCHLNELGRLVRDGKINLDTPVFNNLVANLQDMQHMWLVPLKESWHAGRV